MKRRNLLYLFVLLSGSISAAKAQIYNDGGLIFMQSNTLLYIEKSYTHNDGTINANGQIVVNGDWQNKNAANPVFNDLSDGPVVFTSDAARIGGNGITRFPKLVFAGNTNSSITYSVEAKLGLDLGDEEVILNSSTLSLLNPDAASLIRKSGYINTDNNSAFIRNTNQTADYLFPLGSSSLNRYRPVSIKPKDVQSNSLSAALVNKDADLDGYSRQNKRGYVDYINDKYYFKIGQPAGLSGFDLTLYASAADGDFNSMVSWAGIWDKKNTVKTPAPTGGTGPELAFTQSVNTSLTASMPYNLAAVTLAEDPLVFFNAFSPDGDGINDRWEIKNIDDYPENDLTIFDRSGNTVYKTKEYNGSKSWDGNNLQAGVYYYILRVNINGKDKVYKGAITMAKK